MDSTELTNVDNALVNTFSTLRNRATGLGTTRDKSQLSEINLEWSTLSSVERSILFRSKGLCKKVVSVYPLAAASKWIDFTANKKSFETDGIHKYFENLATGNLKDKFIEASIEARLHGDAYLLLGIDDGEDWSDPVEETSIKSLRWVEVLYHQEVSPDLTFGINPVHYYVTATVNDSLQSVTDDSKINFIKVHKSRILRFTGHRLYGETLRLNAGRNDSVLQPIFNEFRAYITAVDSSAAMLADYSLFTYKLKGLASLIQKGQEDKILERFLALQMGMSISKGLMMDAENEDASFVNRSYAGVKDITEVLLEQFVAACDIPRYKLLGETNKGSSTGGNKSEQERFEWASLVHAYQIEKWYGHLKYLLKIILLSADSPHRGKIPKFYDVIFPSIFEQSPLEDQEMRLKKADEHSKNIQNNIYTAYEARMSTYGKTNWHNEIELDDRISQTMEPINKQNLSKDPETISTDDYHIRRKMSYDNDSSNLDAAIEVSGKPFSDDEYEAWSDVSTVDVLGILENIVSEK